MEKSGLFGFKAVRKCFITTLNGRRQLNAFYEILMWVQMERRVFYFDSIWSLPPLFYQSRYIYRRQIQSNPIGSGAFKWQGVKLV